MWIVWIISREIASTQVWLEGNVNTQRIISMMNVCDDELVVDFKRNLFHRELSYGTYVYVLAGVFS